MSTVNLKLLPQFANATTKSGKPVKRSFADIHAFVAHANANGLKVNIADPDVRKDLAAAGCPERRISAVAWAMRHYFGLEVKAERTGRKVSSYQIVDPTTASAVDTK